MKYEWITRRLQVTRALDISEENKAVVLEVLVYFQSDKDVFCASYIYIKALYQARESSLVLLRLLTVHFLQKI